MAPENYLGMECKDCGLEWLQTFKLPMPVDDWLKTFRKVRCPKCNAPFKRLGCTNKPDIPLVMSDQ
jgi:hypothetical protein